MKLKSPGGYRRVVEHVAFCTHVTEGSRCQKIIAARFRFRPFDCLLDSQVYQYSESEGERVKSALNVRQSTVCQIFYLI